MLKTFWVKLAKLVGPRLGRLSLMGVTEVAEELELDVSAAKTKVAKEKSMTKKNPKNKRFNILPESSLLLFNTFF